MIVIMLSRDPEVMRPGSAASRRMDEYRSLCAKFYVLVFDPRRGKFTAVRDLYTSAREAIMREQGSGDKILITAQDPFEVGLVGALLKQRFGCSLELQIHTDLLSPFFKAESLKNKIRLLIARRILPKADCIRVVSERIKNSVLLWVPALDPRRVRVQPIFVDTSKFGHKEVAFRSGPFVFVAVSRLSQEKNIILLLEAFREVLRKEKNVHLVIVGDGPERKNLGRAARAMVIQNAVEFVGWQAENLADYYASAEWYVRTSNSEGYARSVIEAMAASLPVIMTDVGIAREIVKDNINGLIVPVGDVHALVSRMLWVMRDEALRTTLRQNARISALQLTSKEAYLKTTKDAWEFCCHI